MALTIKAISYKGHPLDSPIEVVFDEKGGTVGRSPRNDLVLMDNEKVVSGEHATITYEDGSYHYTDTSLNGTRVTNRDKWVRHDKIRLEHDDKLQIGEYLLALSIAGNNAQRSPSGHLQPARDPFLQTLFGHNHLPDREPAISDILGGEDLPDPNGKEGTHEKPDFHSGLSNDQGAAIDASFVPPEPMAVEPREGHSPFPENLTLEDFFGSDMGSRLTAVGTQERHELTHSNERYQGLSISRADGRKDFSELLETPACLGNTAEQMVPIPSASGRTKAAVEKSRSRPAEDIAGPLREFLNAAGVEQTGVYSAEEQIKLMRIAGSTIRELVEGLMTVLRGRSEFKSQLRVSMTTLKPVANNPFKFSTTVEEALKTCLSSKHPGFLNSTDAIHEGIEDIQNHQLAMTAGIQASLESILKRFDPQRFAEKFREGLVLQKKAKCWDAYRQAYRQIVEEALEDIFGEVFVRAYEEQIAKLRTKQKQTANG
jgi:type VI secretion system FHA domain protein